MNPVIRRLVTGNICGTDTWAHAKPCECANCAAWMAEAPASVDQSEQTLVGGVPVPDDRSHAETKPNGQQKAYVVLSADERAKGFTRPYRDAYKHTVPTCGAVTTMAQGIAETYARTPFFYTGTFCVRCRQHFPIGINGQFNWYEMDGSIGPKVGT